MKLTESRTPTTKNVNKFINDVNDFIKVCHRKKAKDMGQQPYSIVGHKEKAKNVGQQPYQSAVHDSSAVRVPSNVNSILNVSDVPICKAAVRVRDSNPEVTVPVHVLSDIPDTNVHLLNVRGLDTYPQDVCSYAQ